MSHDVSKSSNPDIQELVSRTDTLARALGSALVRLEALEVEVAGLPQQFVVPGPNGEIPVGTIVAAAQARLGSRVRVVDDGADHSFSDALGHTAASDMIAEGGPVFSR